jgi:hypothetical protein
MRDRATRLRAREQQDRSKTTPEPPERKPPRVTRARDYSGPTVHVTDDERGRRHGEPKQGGTAEETEPSGLSSLPIIEGL